MRQICSSYIDGTSLPAAGDKSTPNYHPGTNAIINHMVHASDSDLQHAIVSSHHALKLWSQLSINHRSAVILRAAEILRSRVNELAELEVWDTGKPIAEALTVDVLSAADALEYFAKAAVALESHVVPNHAALIYTINQPIGVCVGIGAWNYPLQIACWKAAPALMMGNTMIFKPSELTPMTALALAEIFIEAGMPAGVFNVVLGDGETAEKLLSMAGIAKISFTGSVATGKKILQQAARHLVPVTLELGGKSPLIIFDDANLDQAVIGVMLANFYTQGEICSNGTRVYVAKSLHDAFIEKIVARVKKLVIGDPFNKSTQVGALISRSHLQKVMHYIESGQAGGAELIYGGRQPATLKNGNFIEPTIFANCRDDMTIVRDEIFGPVMSVLTFDDEDDVIRRANNSSFGLAAGVFTDNIKRGHRVAKQLEAGMCWINNYNVTPVGMPFGGCKQSGFGRENGIPALLGYVQQKSVYVELNEIDHTYD